ncbi:unnamed protein product [Jaminaea pallidilutea]
MAEQSNSTAVGGPSSSSSPNSQPAKRSVSFRSSPSTKTIPEFSAFSSSESEFTRPRSTSGARGNGSSGHTSANSSTGDTSSSTPLGPLKPALKPSSRKLPPQEQYQHPDPLIRRLRLVDGRGKPIDLQKYFRDCKVLALYFSSQWAGMPLKEYQKIITDFQSKHPHEFKVVYVSVDVDEEWYKAGVEGKPWVSMVWNDGSSLPSERSDYTASTGFGSNLKASSAADRRSGAASSGSDDGSSGVNTPLTPSEPLPPVKLHNEEDFLLAGEIDIDSSLSLTDTAGTSYLRPYSRVHLASKLDILAAPTLAIYHVPTRRLIERNARMRRMQEHEGPETWARWSKGEGAGGLGLQDAIHSNRAMVLVALLSLGYFLMVKIGGPEFNFIPRLLGQVEQKVINPALTEQLRG